MCSNGTVEEIKDGERGEKREKGRRKKERRKMRGGGGNVSTHSLKPSHLLDCTEKVGHDMWGQDTCHIGRS